MIVPIDRSPREGRSKNSSPPPDGGRRTMGVLCMSRIADYRRPDNWGGELPRELHM